MCRVRVVVSQPVRRQDVALPVADTVAIMSSHGGVLSDQHPVFHGERNMKPTPGCPRTSGFTLIEMIAVMVVLSVLAATVSLRWGATDSTISYQADLLARNLRHAQMLAMTWGQSLRITGTGASYSVACVAGSPSPPCNTSPGPVIDPATGSAFTVTLSNNVTVSATAVEIDSLGRPLSAGVLLSVARIFTLSGAGQTWSVRVAPITGFVSVSSP